uniref:Uncharacterized protein n=1 Tax=Prymnesium polylepis TaxID=72548 RepID=A0A7S4IY29_9EUKA
MPNRVDAVLLMVIARRRRRSRCTGLSDQLRSSPCSVTNGVVDASQRLSGLQRAGTRPAMAMRTPAGSWPQRRRPAAGRSAVVGRDDERAAEHPAGSGLIESLLVTDPVQAPLR